MSKAISTVGVYSRTSSMRGIENFEDNEVPLSSYTNKYYSSASSSSSSSSYLHSVPRTIPRTTSTREDFQEDDVWSVVEDYSSSPNKYYISSSASSKKNTSSPSSTCVPRKTPKTASTHEASSSKVVQKSSAPVDIPDWSKIYGRKNARNMGSWNDDHDHGNGYHDKYHHSHNDDVNDDGDGDGDGDGDDMLPPHEWLARRLARSQICSSSVYEGIGRKLKGRDLTNVRQAILTKTGFIEQ